MSALCSAETVQSVVEHAQKLMLMEHACTTSMDIVSCAYSLINSARTGASDAVILGSNRGLEILTRFAQLNEAELINDKHSTLQLLHMAQTQQQQLGICDAEVHMLAYVEGVLRQC